MAKSNTGEVRTEQIRTALQVLADRHGGYLSPSRIVEAARDPSSILHDEFNWDDDDAANQYRIAQARALVRRVRFTLVRQPEQTKVVNLSISRPTREAHKANESTTVIPAPRASEDMVDWVLKELTAYRRRHADLIALTPIWRAIDDVSEELAASSPERHAEAGQARLGPSR
jgi:hypothetical protein